MKPPEKAVDPAKGVWGKIAAKSEVRAKTRVQPQPEKKPGVLIAAAVLCALVVVAVIVLAIFGEALGIFPGEDKPDQSVGPSKQAQKPVSWGDDSKKEPKAGESKAGGATETPKEETEEERKAREERERKRQEREAKRKKEEEFRQWMEAARVYLEKEQYREAKRSIEAALKIKPDDPAAKALLAKADIVIFVPGDCKTIQEAVDGAEKGQIVLVADGTYKGKGNRDVELKGKAITIRSENGAGKCIIDCEDSGRGFYFGRYETAKTVVQGFSIKNGKVTGDGGGICCKGSSSPTIIGCRIIDCSATNGGGVSCWSRSNPTLINCVIAGNTAKAKGGGVSCWNNCSPEIINCTIAENRSEKCGGGISASERSKPELKNTIVWDNKVTKANEETTGRKPARTGPKFNEDDIKGHDLYTYDSSSTIQLRYCCYPSNKRDRNSYSGEGKIDHSYHIYQDPEFEGSYSARYQLGSGSSCINKGNDEYVPSGITTDIAGRPRIVAGSKRWGSKVDIGAYERQ